MMKRTEKQDGQKERWQLHSNVHEHIEMNKRIDAINFKPRSVKKKDEKEKKSKNKIILQCGLLRIRTKRNSSVKRLKEKMQRQSI
jgi:hypothetical protein